MDGWIKMDEWRRSRTLSLCQRATPRSSNLSNLTWQEVGSQGGYKGAFNNRASLVKRQITGITDQDKKTQQNCIFRASLPQQWNLIWNWTGSCLVPVRGHSNHVNCSLVVTIGLTNKLLVYFENDTPWNCNIKLLESWCYISVWENWL